MPYIYAVTIYSIIDSIDIISGPCQQLRDQPVVQAALI